MIASFKPIIDRNCKILILGSMPSVMSLEKQQYYGNKQNQFWNILYGIFNSDIETDYEKRKTFLLNHSIALWDVLESCDREGSSDSKIINPVPNDLANFLNEYSNIEAIYFNGGKAEELFRKLVIEKINQKECIAFYRLPSTSPANAIKFSEKFQQWKIILNNLL